MTDDTIVVVTSRSPGDHLFLMAPDHSGDFRKKILVTNGYLAGANVDVWKIIGSANLFQNFFHNAQALFTLHIRSHGSGKCLTMSGHINFWDHHVMPVPAIYVQRSEERRVGN